MKIALQIKDRFNHKAAWFEYVHQVDNQLVVMDKNNLFDYYRTDEVMDIVVGDLTPAPPGRSRIDDILKNYR